MNFDNLIHYITEGGGSVFQIRSTSYIITVALLGSILGLFAFALFLKFGLKLSQGSYTQYKSVLKTTIPLFIFNMIAAFMGIYSASLMVLVIIFQLILLPIIISGKHELTWTRAFIADAVTTGLSILYIFLLIFLLTGISYF